MTLPTNDTDSTPAEHSPEATRELAEFIRDTLKEVSDDDEAEIDLDVYDKIVVQGKVCKIKITTDEAELEYIVTIEPID